MLKNKINSSANSKNSTKITFNPEAYKELFTKSYINRNPWCKNEFVSEGINLYTDLFQKTYLNKELYVQLINQEIVSDNKSFKFEIQAPRRGFYNGKESDNPHKIMLVNRIYDENFIFIELLTSKDGGTAISLKEHIHTKHYYKLDRDLCYNYLDTFINDDEINTLKKKFDDNNRISSICELD